MLTYIITHACHPVYKIISAITEWAQYEWVYFPNATKKPL